MHISFTDSFHIFISKPSCLGLSIQCQEYLMKFQCAGHYWVFKGLEFALKVRQKITKWNTKNEEMRAEEDVQTGSEGEKTKRRRDIFLKVGKLSKTHIIWPWGMRVIWAGRSFQETTRLCLAFVIGHTFLYQGGENTEIMGKVVGSDL